MKTILFAILLISIQVLGQTTDYRINNIIYELTEVRTNPCKYAHRYDFDICQFEASEKMLKYDKKLAKESQEYADYLLKRSKKIKNYNYFLVHSSDKVICNESLAWVGNPSECVKYWIEEHGYKGDGHRLHMMNVKECHKSDTKIGVGISYDDVNQNWFVVLRTK